MLLDTWFVISIILRISCFLTAYTVWRTVWENDNICLPGDELDPLLKLFFSAIAVLTAAAGATLGF